MRILQICLLSGKHLAETFENAPLVEKSQKCNQCNYEESNKCNLCNYAFFRACYLRIHLKKHTGENSKKCNECDLASFQANNYGHKERKPNKCNYCKYAFSQAGNLRLHLKRTVEKSQRNVRRPSVL